MPTTAVRCVSALVRLSARGGRAGGLPQRLKVLPQLLLCGPVREVRHVQAPGIVLPGAAGLRSRSPTRNDATTTVYIVQSCMLFLCSFSVYQVASRDASVAHDGARTHDQAAGQAARTTILPRFECTCMCAARERAHLYPQDEHELMLPRSGLGGRTSGGWAVRHSRHAGRGKGHTTT